MENLSVMAIEKSAKLCLNENVAQKHVTSPNRAHALLNDILIKTALVLFLQFKCC